MRVLLALVLVVGCATQTQRAPDLGESDGGAEFDVGDDSSGGGLDVSAMPMETGGDSDCPSVTVKIDRTVPTVMLAVDQSGSMNDSFGGSGTRWSVMRDALMNPTTGIVKKLEKDVRFGLTLFTSKGGFAGGTCPMLTEVPVALSNYSAIKAIYDPASPIKDTPTGESVTAIATRLLGVTEVGPKYLILATDGDPDTCADPDPPPPPLAHQKVAVEGVQSAFAKGIPVIVISVGSDITLSHLQDLANAGAGLPIGGAVKAKYYQALDPGALVTSLEEVINGVRSCAFKLDGKVVKAAAGMVSLDGTALGLGEADGWKLTGESEIELTGEACKKIKAGEHTLTVSFRCDGIIK